MNNSKFVRIATVAATLDLLGHNHLLANGSAWQTGVPSTGSPTASRDQHSTLVSILDELLTINLHQEFAAIDLHYQMRNAGPFTMQDFFFPVERWNDDLKDYSILVDGKPVQWEDVGGPKKKPADEDWGDQPAILSWKHSKIHFDRGQTRQVSISYKARYSTESSAISDDATIGDAIFAYSLSPASTWNGPIGKGHVIINVLNPLPGDVKFIKPQDHFRKINDLRYEWSFENLKPTLDDDIRIAVHPGYQSFPADQNFPASNSSSYTLYPNRYFLDHVNYDVKASSTLKPEGDITYVAENVKGANPDRAWAEGDGIGEHLDLTVHNPLRLEAILIMPGYAARRQNPGYSEGTKVPSSAWGNNNRVAQLNITLNGEYTFSASIPDEEFQDPYPIVIPGYSKPVKTIRIVIAGVHPGAKYNDTCISLIELRSKLSKKPVIGPIR